MSLLRPFPLRQLLGSLLFVLLGALPVLAQDDDLLQELEAKAADSTRSRVPDFTLATFKGTHIINSQSVETPGKARCYS
ncbi:hypothetical protein [Hymenobacter cellulosilyticus]|uniref:Uncharacterized protein n=1 Tax=Hymenobacter cellulosilyticus TaxID=2932248 RepID=A0A8T9Q7E8_9BACT|nr:hypothetical protein [Hymenobacter cellulosilyticus]UOQ72351.1 hypothetical protein MUN79_28060 [Hymenobacter cellulosilyticus]